MVSNIFKNNLKIVQLAKKIEQGPCISCFSLNPLICMLNA